MHRTLKKVGHTFLPQNPAWVWLIFVTSFVSRFLCTPGLGTSKSMMGRAKTRVGAKWCRFISRAHLGVVCECVASGFNSVDLVIKYVHVGSRCA
ncbi:hypothetical protein DFP73DRAFT_108942 [Morchella snyderi]|nr:hypothetical protein DFP73DRAFT_108942 [Morchella snyderi]